MTNLVQNQNLIWIIIFIKNIKIRTTYYFCLPPFLTKSILKLNYPLIKYKRLLNNPIQYKKMQQNPKSNPKKTSLTSSATNQTHCCLITNAYYLETDLNTQSNTQYLLISLTYINDWKKYTRRLTKLDIGKDINSKIQLEDIYYAIHDHAQKSNQINIINIGINQIIGKNKSNQIKVQKQGKITIINKFYSQRGGKAFEKICDSVIKLEKVGTINQTEKLTIFRKQVELDIQKKYQAQIANLTTQNQNLKNKLKQINQKQTKVQIFVKDLVGRTGTYNISLSQSVLSLKELIQDKNGIPIDQQRLIYRGNSLQNDQLSLSDYNVVKQCTLHLVLKLRGSIGVFDEYLASPYRNLLTGQECPRNHKLSTDTVNNLIKNVRGNPEAHFTVIKSDISGQILQKIVNYANQKYQLTISLNAKDVDDLKLKISREILVNLTGQQICRQMEALFGSYDEIIIRRCKSYGKMIDFHLDSSARTMQLTLNNENQYEGGRLLYATQGQLHTLKRPRGTITIHDDTIVHGVTMMKSGVRHSLFFLKK